MDHYQVLGLSRSATKDQIKEAFHKIALQFHPDKHASSPTYVRDDATRRFKKAYEAYNALINDRRYANYYENTNTNSYNQNYGYGRRSSSTYYRCYNMHPKPSFFIGLSALVMVGCFIHEVRWYRKNLLNKSSEYAKLYQQLRERNGED